MIQPKTPRIMAMKNVKNESTTADEAWTPPNPKRITKAASRFQSANGHRQHCNDHHHRQENKIAKRAYIHADSNSYRHHGDYPCQLINDRKEQTLKATFLSLR
jgi:hypothetical protein